MPLIPLRSLTDLSTMPVSRVRVPYENPPSNQYNQLWRITFVDPELGGVVEPIAIVDKEITGSNVVVSVLSDDLESPAQRGYSLNGSVAGNHVSGQFSLTYCGHTTEMIDFNATDIEVKAKLDGVVDVERIGPSV
jgi:hypothetical protein